MSVNVQEQTGTYTRRVAEANAQSIVEIKFSAQEAGEAVAIEPQISLNSCEVSSGRFNYGGRLVCTLVYSDGEGKLCRVQKGAEFSHYIDDDKFVPAQRGECTLKCESSRIKREGSSWIVSVVVGAEIAVYDETQRSFVSAIDGAVCRTEPAKLYSMVNFSGESEVDDDFECVAADVLVPSAKALVLDCNVRSGVVEISGEIALTLLAVRDNSPVCLDRVIPFKCEISCDEALLARRAFCRAEVKSLNVNCKVNEEKAKCNVEFNAVLSFEGRFYEEEEVSLVADAFGLTQTIGLTYSEETADVNDSIKVYSERVNGACAAKAKLDYTCAFLAAALPKAEFSRTAEGIEGSITATLLYEQAGEIHSAEVNMPFAVTLSGLSENCSEINVAVCGMSLRQRAEGECEAEASLKITAADCERKCVKYVTSVTEGEPVTRSDSAISVYIPTAGDGLWETAKRLCESPDNIQKTNPDLKFPLTGKERLIIYRSKQA